MNNVYLDPHRHSYLRVRSGENYHWFLTMQSGDIDVVKVSEEKMKHWQPYQCDYAQALRTYTESTLARTPAASKELALLLQRGCPDAPVRKVVAPEFAPAGKIQGGVTVEALAKELGMPGPIARKILRKRMAKPGSRWVWPDREAAAEALAILQQEKL